MCIKPRWHERAQRQGIGRSRGRWDMAKQLSWCVVNVGSSQEAAVAVPQQAPDAFASTAHASTQAYADCRHHLANLHSPSGPETLPSTCPSPPPSLHQVLLPATSSTRCTRLGCPTMAASRWAVLRSGLSSHSLSVGICGSSTTRPAMAGPSFPHLVSSSPASWGKREREGQRKRGGARKKEKEKESERGGGREGGGERETERQRETTVAEWLRGNGCVCGLPHPHPSPPTVTGKPNNKHPV